MSTTNGSVPKSRKEAILKADTPPVHHINPEGIAPYLLGINRWILWKWKRVKAKWTKVPCNDRGWAMDALNPANWRDFNTVYRIALERGFGIGFVFNGDGIHGIDLDDCYDPTTGTLTQTARELVETVDSYTEISPSATGIKIFVFGQLPEQFSNEYTHPGGECGVELYATKRFFTITGHRLPDTPDDVADHPVGLTAAHEVFQSWTKKKKSENLADIDLSDVADDLATARAALAELDSDMSYNSWRNVLMACHAVGVPIGEVISWSRRSDKFAEGEVEKKWKSFKRNGVGIGTLCWMADQTGKQWRPEKPKQSTGSSNSHSVDSVYNVYASEEWGEPIPLAEDPVAPCPVDAIPEGPREFLVQLAEFTQTPVDLAVGQWLAACAIAVQKKFVVEPSRGWKEQLSLYVLSVMEPANRKSAVVSAIANPIRQFEAEKRQAMAPAIRNAHSQHEVRLKQRNRLVDEAAKALFGEDRDALLHDLEQLDEEIARNLIPSEPTMLADDITPEHLGTLMSRNGGRLGVLTAEGDLFDIIGGRYSKAPNMGVILKAHSGDEVRVDRGNRPSELIRRPALSMGFCVQPEVLRGLLEQDKFRGRGMMGRLLYQNPESLLGHRKIRPAEVDPLVEVAYLTSMARLLNLSAEEDDDGYIARSLRLSHGADSAFCGFREQIEKAFLDFNSLSQIKDWGGKLPGAVARIAGILHLVAYTEYTEIPPLIDEATITSAIRLGEYFESHALSAFRIMGRDEKRSLAELILKTIQGHNLATFTKRDVHQIVRRHVNSPDDLDKPLELLVDHGYVREREPTKQARSGRKSSPVFDVNPSVLASK